MGSIQRILVAVKDPTAASLPAVAKAAQLAQRAPSLVKQMSVDPHLRIASKPVNADELLGVLTALRASA